MKTPRILLILAAIMWLVVFKARGADVPVIFIPGYAASTPKEKMLVPFLFQRGAPPESLRLSASYDLLVRSLKNAGYREGKTFFGAVYDWRMKAAPTDADFDGELSEVTAKSITSGQFEYAVDYVGYWLDQVMQANPTTEYVDVVTHSTGGILARAYLQSPAYGAAYVDAKGVSRKLPKIRYLILGACPNEGTVHSWRPWQGDFQDALSGFIPTTEMEARLAALAFAVVSGGGVIKGPDYEITRESILQPDKNGQSVPDETTFFRQYVPMRQSLMPTLDFLEATDGTKANVNLDPTLRSDVLLDLNATSTAGDNPWAKLVVKNAAFQGGVYATFASGAREKKGLPDFIIPKLVNKNPYIQTLNVVQTLTDEDGEYLPLLPLLLEKDPTPIPVTDSPFVRIGDEEISEPLAGDGNAPFASYLSTFADDPNIRRIQWGNGAPPDDLPANVEWENETNLPVYHDVFFYNPDVRKFVVEMLAGKRMRNEPVILKPELERLLGFLEGHELDLRAEDLRKLEKYLDRDILRELQKRVAAAAAQSKKAAPPSQPSPSLRPPVRLMPSAR